MVNRNLFGWLIASCALFMSACSNDEMLNDVADAYVSGDMVTVSFTISPEGKTFTTRATGVESESGKVHYPNGDKGEFPQISDGSKANQLIYAVYNDKYELLEQYGNGNISDKDAPHYGQVVMDVNKFPYTINLRLIRKQTYHIVFWAQNKDCNAYDTNDLTMVGVRYSNAKNNDELRDAFYHTDTFSVMGEEIRSVELTRPLAQINVGTAGYNFEYAAKPEGSMENLSEPRKYLYSKIQLKGAARYIDLLRNKVLTEDDLTTKGEYEKLAKEEVIEDVTYDWARIPAYINYMDEEVLNKYPTADLPEVDKQNDETWDDYYRRFKEQFLRVKFYSNDLPNESGEPYLPYVGLEDAEGKEPDTETFKYLSMCYVLVPDYVGSDGKGYKTTLEEVTVWLSDSAEGNDPAWIGPTDAKIFTVSNVPVQRNWRTNIFGKGLVTYNYEPIILIEPNFDGEYNSGDAGNSWASGDNSYGFHDKE